VLVASLPVSLYLIEHRENRFVEHVERTFGWGPVSTLARVCSASVSYWVLACATALMAALHARVGKNRLWLLALVVFATLSCMGAIVLWAKLVILSMPMASPVAEALWRANIPRL